jgi:hypothetical protein
VEVMILIDPQKSSRNSTLDYTVSELPEEILAIVRITWYKNGKADEVDQSAIWKMGKMAMTHLLH